MSNAIVINTLEELKAFLNEKGVMEIAVRNQNKRFKAFQKVMISNPPETQEKELTEKVIHALNINKNTAMYERNLKLLGEIAKLEKIGILLNGLNLCATCAGFAIMYAKLDKMSIQINQQLYQIQKLMKQSQDIQNDYEFNKVLSDHTDMLDSQRRQQPYSEGKMRELVDREYNVLTLLIRSFQKDTSSDNSTLIFSIFSMLAMFTVSLRTFDEIYFFNNHKTLSDKDVWHLAHEKWMSVYDTLSSEWFIEKLQDYGTFETKLTTLGVDIYYISLMDQVAELKEEIEDNQALIVAMGDTELFGRFKEMSSKEIADSIEAAYKEAGAGMDGTVIRAAYQEAMRLAAMI